MTRVFHLWLKPEEPVFSRQKETDPERAEFATRNTVVFVGWPPSLDVFLYDVSERDVIVARCDGFCGIGRAVGAAYILPGAKIRGQVPHYRRIEWISITSRGPTDPNEGFLRGLNVREAVKDITEHCSEGPLAGLL